MKSIFVLSITFSLCLANFGLAQESDASSTESATATQKAFDGVFSQWKDVLSKMRDMQAKAQNAEDSELPAMVTKYDELILKGEQLLPQLRDAAIKVYKESPNEDKQIWRWLSDLAEDYVSKDRFADATPALDALLEGKAPDPTVANNAGIVAYATNDFGTAKKLFETAAAAGVLTGQSQQMMNFADDYIGYWEEEKKLRERADQLSGDARLPRVSMETNRGTMILELFEDEAPETVGNFIHLVESGFYDGLTFHRVLPGFMAQGGCPDGNGSGGPGYEIFCECYNANHRKHFVGSLSMAHTDKRDTGGSQFFITFTPQPQLNGKHTVFGRVVEGLDVLPKIQRRDPKKSSDLALTPDKIIKAEVLNKRDHEYVPNKVK